MEKKEYIKPEIEVVNLEVVEMIATSFGLNEEGGNEGSLSNSMRPGRRGQWGDLWYQGEE